MHKINKFFTILTILTLSFTSYSQTGCGVIINNISALRVPPRPVDNTPICINVQFHIVNKTNGTGGVSVNTIDNTMQRINSFFAPSNISFKKMGIDYINNSNFYNLTNQYESALFSTNVNPYALNFYVVYSHPSNAGAATLGSPYLYVAAPYLNNEATTQHEIGHSFGLLHTFETALCPELINGSNCSTCGDLVCDTPADANTGAVGGYFPDVTNYLSYYHTRGYNRNHFTAGQNLRMRATIESNPMLTSTKSNLCTKTIEGPNSLCYGFSNHTFSISKPDTNIILWTLSSNLYPVTSLSSTNSITVQTQSSIPGQGSITATFPNGEVITKTFWIGKPDVPILSPYSSTGFPYDQYNLPVRCQFDTEWHFESTTEVNSNITDFKFTYNNLTFIKRAGGSPKSRAIIKASELGMQRGQSGNLNVSTVNVCGETIGFVGYITIYNPTLCESGVGVNCVLGRLANPKTYKVFPNPSNDIIYVDLVDENLKPAKNAIIAAELYDILGMPKDKVTIIDNKAIVDVKNLNKGIYILKISIDGQEEGHQISIN